MVGILKMSPLLRAIGVIGAVAALVTGITFASLNSSVTLTNSSVLTTTADLKVYDFTPGDEGYKSSAPGFTVTGLIPGTGVTKQFYLQNSGGVPLKVTARVPIAPPAPVGGYGFSGFENLKVDITGQGCDTTVNTDMAALIAGEVELPCNPLGAGVAGDSNADVAGNYDIKFDIVSSAITGSQAGVGNFDIVLKGTQP
jgi:hypothetical protein